MNARMTRHPVTGHYTRQTRKVAWNDARRCYETVHPEDELAGTNVTTQYRAYNSNGQLVWVTIPR